MTYYLLLTSLKLIIMKNLKVYFLVIAALFIGVNASAQNEVNLGVKAGVNLSNFGGDGVEDADSKVGFSIGATLDYGLTESLFLLTGLDFTTKGAKGKFDDDDDDFEISINPMYLQIPVHAGYKLNMANDAKLVISAGPYVAYGLGGKVKSDFDGVSVSTDFFGDEDKGAIAKRFDFGVGLGVGYEFSKFKIGVGYDFGLANVSNDKDYKVRTQNGYLTFGYKF